MNLRLNTLAKMVDPGSRVADIGTDHAYLPIELVEKGQIDFAVASDVAEGPLENAREDIQAAGFAEKIATRLGPGLSTITAADNIDTVVIAGMGGKLISQILNDAWLKGQHFPTLVLEPNVGEEEVRSWLMIHGYEIIAEDIMAEAGHSYELIKAKFVGKILPLTETELMFGPLILQNKNEVFYQKWSSQAKYFEKLITNLNKAKNKDLERINRIQAKIKMIKVKI
ncbi:MULTISPECIES: class I SAM-dependent methyltransferase [Lactobacillus]|uniref:SAM-dependent methyltransferase n=1 Tax=Lactobacillus xujianguonis TaxID=2495899 RepID=A0A437SXR7_9LACO|nr:MULTISPECIES: class I SAM-dependent methyltransferase [Lactobacillus]RVU71709.1 SAM-dependent methyltransferase [Lactobacillus xujianguonis]RVU77539.1 SAM-dependent methyltransferase [Lactobacillus xujianguonis]